MVSRYTLRRKQWQVVDAIYPIYHRNIFTTAEAAEISGRKGTAIGATLGSLVARGVLEHPNREKRCHYAGTSGPTYWRFTPVFLGWYEGVYLVTT